MVRIQALYVIVAMAMTACSSGPRKIVVGSKNFTEQILLGEIVAAQIERRTGRPVDRKLNLGGTLLAHRALTSGAIDMYPEYTGTALTAILKRPSIGDAKEAYGAVAGEYLSRHGLRWMRPLGFDNTFAMVVRGETARASGLVTLSDAARRAQAWRLGAGYEFLQRSDGFDGLVKTYGLRVEGQPVSMDLGLLYRALEGRQVDLAAANGTDGQLGVLDVVVLRDDRKYFPPYECALVVRSAVLSGEPELEAALEELSGRISDSAMRRMNHEVEGKRRGARDVADEFLKSMGAPATPPAIPADRGAAPPPR